MGYEEIVLKTPQDYIDNRHGANKFLIKEKPSSDIDKIKFWCVEGGHEFISCVTSVRISKNPCKVCHPRILKRTQKEAEEEAADKGFELVSEYTGVTKTHTFRCKSGHLFDKVFNSLRRHACCPVCDKKQDREDRENLVKELSNSTIRLEKYTGSRNPSIFRCNEGHRWKVIFGSFKKTPTCPVCTNRVTKVTKLLTPIDTKPEPKPEPKRKLSIQVKPNALLNSIFK